MSAGAAAAVLWTGGKDSTLALFEARRLGLAVSLLVTFVPPGAEFRAHPLAVIRRQAESLAIAHLEVEIWPPYEAAYRAALAQLAERQAIGTVVSGDIAAVDGRPNWIRECAAGTGIEVLTPLWESDRMALVERVIGLGFEAVFAAVRTPPLSEAWLGRPLDRASLAELRALGRTRGLDVAGEQGEYHTVVLDGPLFRQRLAIEATPTGRLDDLRYVELRSVSLVRKEQARAEPPGAGRSPALVLDLGATGRADAEEGDVVEVWHEAGVADDGRGELL